MAFSTANITNSAVVYYNSIISKLVSISTNNIINMYNHGLLIINYFLIFRYLLMWVVDYTEVFVHTEHTGSLENLLLIPVFPLLKLLWFWKISLFL